MNRSDRAIVHIGYHKTASTWFKKHYYPCVDSHRYVQRRAVGEALIRPHAFAFDPQAARARLGLDDGPPPLLCEEELSGSFETGGHMGALSKELAERIYRVLPKAQIVVFVRHQVDIIAAAYAQYLKQGGTHGPERFLFPARYRKGPWRQPYKMPLFAFEHFSYIGLIRHYRGLFGTGNVHVFAYEAFQRDRRGFLSEYADRLGLEVALDKINFDAANTSYKHRTLRLARILNHLTYRDVVNKAWVFPSRRCQYLRRLLKRFDATALAGRRLTPGELLGDDMSEFIGGFYADSNRVLARETGLPLAAYGYPGVTDGGVAGDTPGSAATRMAAP